MSILKGKLLRSLDSEDIPVLVLGHFLSASHSNWVRVVLVNNILKLLHLLLVLLAKGLEVGGDIDGYVFASVYIQLLAQEFVIHLVVVGVQKLGFRVVLLVEIHLGVGSVLVYDVHHRQLGSVVIAKLAASLSRNHPLFPLSIDRGYKTKFNLLGIISVCLTGSFIFLLVHAHFKTGAQRSHFKSISLVLNQVALLLHRVLASILKYFLVLVVEDLLSVEDRLLGSVLHSMHSWRMVRTTGPVDLS